MKTISDLMELVRQVEVFGKEEMENNGNETVLNQLKQNLDGEITTHNIARLFEILQNILEPEPERIINRRFLLSETRIIVCDVTTLESDVEHSAAIEKLTELHNDNSLMFPKDKNTKFTIEYLGEKSNVSDATEEHS